jgi:hypothetical protein
MSRVGYSFRNGSASGARGGNGPLGAGVTALFGGIGGLALGALAVAALVATCFFAVGTFAACFALNIPSALLAGFFTVAALGATDMCARGSAWMFGTAKGAVMDSRRARQVSSESASAPPAAETPVPRYAGTPPKNEFNHGAARGALREAAAQARKAAARFKP